MKNNSRTTLLLCLGMAAGILLGTVMTCKVIDKRLGVLGSGNGKIGYMIQLIERDFVDSINIDAVVENVMPKVLSELDPHSTYVPAKDAKEAEEDLKGSFSGIGISFRMKQDSVTVMNVMRGGPAEKVGILAGDRIISANDTCLCKMPSTKVMKHLKGLKNTEVVLKVVRHGRTEPLTFTVVRDDIRVESVEASFMMEGNVGYISVNNFGEQTFAEMLSALAHLHYNGMKSLIVDLRGNHGGYMHVAIQMVNEFLAENQLIVYTEGRNVNRSEFRANGRGSFQSVPLVVLIDEGSASSSEIFAGAIQDNDRGMILGRRSFGKGLVQKPIELTDGSALRLTVARYYTPSGRCIQKPYENGHGEDYENEIMLRYERGEFYVEDSIKQEGAEYKTRIGRTVYGGGGIRPDIFIPADTANVTSYYKEAVYRGLIAEFCFEVVDQNRDELNKLESLEEKVKWLEKKNILESFARYAEKKSLPRRNLLMRKSQDLFRRSIYSGIIYNSGDMNDYLRFLNQDDPVVINALDVILNGRTFPVAPVVKDTKTEEKE